MAEEMIAQVECCSDWNYAGRPLAFMWQGQRLEVSALLYQSRTPAGRTYRVQTATEGSFDLLYLEAEDVWRVLSVA